VKFLAALFVPAALCAAILPDTIGPYQRTGTSQPVISDRQVWDEYGLRDYETGAYANGGAKMSVTVYQLQDSTGALAAFDWQRPANAKPSNAARYAAETADGLLFVHGNYLLSFAGYRPPAAELSALGDSLRNVDGTPFPTLPGFLPSQDLVPNSERYVVGPASLQKFVPGIPPSVAAFHLDSEAQVGVFHTPKGNVTLAIFNYPSPNIARQRVIDFQNLPGVVAKRTGPLVAAVTAPADPDEAEKVLARVQYRAEITQQEHIPTRKDNIGNLVINAFILVGILLVCCIVGGLGVGGIRLLRRRGKENPDADAMITLHLDRG
jgi:hypothetical protein